MLFITLRSVSAQQVPKVLAVVEQTKRLRHKSGIEETDPLFQYVVYDTPQRKGPKRINLDDAPKKTPYAPPTSLTIHLSKIDMPELRPRVDPTAASHSPKSKPAQPHETSFSSSGPSMPSMPAVPVPLQYNSPASDSGKTKDDKKKKDDKDKKDKVGKSSGFGLLSMGKSDSKHKKGTFYIMVQQFVPTSGHSYSIPLDSSTSAPTPNKLSKPHASSPSGSFMPAPGNPHSGPPSRPHSPYVPPSSSPFTTQPPSSPWTTSGPGYDMPGAYSTPPQHPQHPYTNSEPGFVGGFGGGGAPPPPPPQHPQHNYGGYNPGYI